MVPPDALQWVNSIELGIILTRMVQRANHRRHARQRAALCADPLADNDAG